MSILDNVKNKIGDIADRRGFKNKWDNRYDDGYDDYDDGYDDDYYDDDYDDYDDQQDRDTVSSRVTPRGAGNVASWPGELSGGSRRESRLSETTPLVTNADVRARAYERPGHSEHQQVSGRPNYESSLQSYDIKPRETLGRGSNHSEESLQAAREELASLQQGIPVPLNSYAGQRSTGEDGTIVTGVKSTYPSSVSRRIATIIPTSYADAAKVSEAFRNGTSAVVSLTAVSPDLARRILDFCFGVVSVSGGSVDKIGSKAFFLSHGGASITDTEIQQLKDMGVL